MLKYLGIFDKFYTKSRPLKKLHIVDATNRLLRAPEVVFSANELDIEYFALNVPMGAILTTLCAELPKHSNVTCLFNNKIEKLEQQTSSMALTLSDGLVINTKLLIGADGRNSVARKFANIDITTKLYPQTALGFAFKHDRDLGDFSVEFHRKNGPFTLIPMQNPEKGFQTSLVWSESHQDAERIKNLPKPELAELINKISNGIVGKITEIGYIASFPLANIHCSTYAQDRIILVGEAAHILPPIGAQGMNLGFQDAAIVDDLVLNSIKTDSDVGSDLVMKQYTKQRKMDINTRGKATDLLNISLLSNFIPMQFARGMGLFMLQKSKTMRVKIMQKALHPLGRTPTSML